MNATITALQRLEADFEPAFLTKLLVPDVRREALEPKRVPSEKC